MIKFRKDLSLLLSQFNLEGNAVEVGVAEGRMSEILIQNWRIKKFYMVDAWRTLNQSGDGHNPQSWHDANYSEALRRTNTWSTKRVVLQGLSKDMIEWIPDDSLILSYVDASHSYQDCLDDLRAIWPKMKQGSIISGHDVLNPSYGVGRAVQEFAKGHGLEINIIEEDEPNNASFWMRK